MAGQPAVELSSVSKLYRAGTGDGVVPVPRILPGKRRDAARSLQPDQKKFSEPTDDDLDDEEPEEVEAPAPRKDVWALRDVDLEVPVGETLGIVGPNGSGKTTLLKLLARITPPTSGDIVIRGRVAPVLSLATGLMQPNLTGRRNIHFLGQLFGAPREVVLSCESAIAAFAGLGKDLERHVGTYSKGELQRLAFSVALNLEADVFVADEVLAVGDAAFKRRCLERVEEAVADGRTFLFASHSGKLMRQICHRVVWLDSGRVVESGPTDEILDRYERVEEPMPLSKQRLSRGQDDVDAKQASRLGQVLDAGIYEMDGEPTEMVSVAEDSLVELKLDIRKGDLPISCSLTLAADGRTIARIVQRDVFRVPKPGRYTASVCLPGGLLPDARYQGRATAWIVSEDDRVGMGGDPTFEFVAFDPTDTDIDDDEDEDEEELGATEDRLKPRLPWLIERDRAGSPRD